MDKLLHPNIEDVTLEGLLHALSDPIRLEIFRRLYSSEEEGKCGCFVDLGKKNNLSHHFKVLRESGVIKVRIDGGNRFISTRKDEINKKFPGLLSSIYNGCEENKLL